MMKKLKKIRWNKVTWYSKLLAAIFFIFIVPLLTFKIGTEYENTKIILRSFETQATPITETITASPQDLINVNSGIIAQVTTADRACQEKKSCKGSVYKGFITIKTIRGKLVTTTKIRDDGTFLAMLSPGSYKVSPVSSVPMPSIDPVVIVIKDGQVTKESIQFKIDPQS